LVDTVTLLINGEEAKMPVTGLYECLNIREVLLNIYRQEVLFSKENSTVGNK
jgi:hypothetical protein